VPGALYAVDAMTLQALWDSNRVQDDIRTLTKGSGPLVVNGKVYVPSLSRTVAVFGARTGPTPTIKQGVYQIRTSLGSDKCVDVAGGSTADKADIQQYGCNGTDAQRWWISNYSGDIYTISSMRSGKCLDVELAAPGDKIRVQQFACNSTVAQRWRIVPIGNGKYELRPQTTTPNKCLDVAGGLPNDSTKLQQFGCNQTNSQRFTLALDGVSAFGEGTYSITTATGPNLCLDVDLGQYADNIDVQQYNCNGTYSQRWHFRQITGNTYEVRAAVSNKCLDVSWGDPAPGAGIQQYECNDTGAQQWQISPAGTGRFRFSPLTAAAGTNCLDVVDRSSASLQQYYCNGIPAQLFGIIAP
jgi:hypothetical protein